MQNIRYDGRNNQIQSLPDNRPQIKNDNKKVQCKRIEKIHPHINASRLDIFRFKISMALKNIITHCKNGNIDRNKILRNQSQIIIKSCQLI